MRCQRSVVLCIALLASGCMPAVIGTGPRPAGDSDVVVVGNGGKVRGPRRLNGVPPGHYPPPGECRLWYAGRPPGHQPPPGRCSALVGRVPAGAFILYGGEAWDTDYDWPAHARQNPDAVPAVILELLRDVRGS